MSHLALFKHETQAIKNPPPTFQTVSRSRILRSSPLGFSQEGGIGVARLKESSSSEARMIAECVLCTRLSCDVGHS
jgi:hypothetical protein